LGDKEQKLEDLKKQCTNTKKELTETTTTLSSEQQKLQEVVTQLEKNTQELIEKQQKLQDLTPQIEGKTNELQDIEHNINRKNKKLARKNARLEKATAALEEKQGELKKITRKIDRRGKKMEPTLERDLSLSAPSMPEKKGHRKLKHKSDRETKPKPEIPYKYRDYSDVLPQIINAQRIAKRWLHRHKLKCFNIQMIKKYMASDITKTLRNRNKVLREIHSTEGKYIEGLETIVDVFIKPLRKSNLLGQAECDIIFSDIEIILDLNRIFFEKLSKRLDQWPTVQMFGDIFKESMPVMKLYYRHIRNFPKAEEMVAQCQKKKRICRVLEASL